MVKRGANSPSVSDDSHWNDDAQRIWYEENKYDMQYADEEMDEDMDGGEQPTTEEEWFDTEAAARKFYDELDKGNVAQYDKAVSLISELINSSLDGPEQMRYISMVIEQFDKYTGTESTASA